MILVIYKSQTRKMSHAIKFYNINQALKWSEDFVKESRKNQGYAEIFRHGERFCSYHNLNGEVLKSQ